MISTIVTDILAAGLVLGIIVVIHELGHFLAAKLFKIRVEIFSIGFGPRLIGFRRGDTDYRLSAFPFGGYVRMTTEEPSDNVTGAPHEFMSKPRWQRFIVAAAGPAMNVVLAVALLTGLFMYGTEVPAFSEGAAIIGGVEPGSPAEAAGLQEGDRIVAMDGKLQPKWDEVAARVVTNAGQKVAVTLNRHGEIIDTFLTPARQERSGGGYVGIHPDLLETNVVDELEAGSPAETAGLQPGDVITAVNGIEIRTPTATAVQKSIRSVPQTAKTFPLTFLRNGQRHDIRVGRNLKDGEPVAGIDFVTPMVKIRENFSGAFGRSIDKNLEYGTMIFQVLGKLLTRKVSMKSVDGPIGIVHVAGQSFEAGLAPLVMLMAMISLNLGMMNLLPIPILDGGVMLLLIVESLMGQDLSLAMRERIVQFGFVFLVLLSVVVLYNDVVKLLPQ